MSVETVVASAAASERNITVLRYRRAAHGDNGWAAQRLLQQYDLQPEKGGMLIVNASPFCVEER